MPDNLVSRPITGHSPDICLHMCIRTCGRVTVEAVDIRLRVVIITESFFPQVNGVTNSVRHLVEQLELLGHGVLVVAPGDGPTRHSRSRVVRVRGVTLPGYRSFVVGLPDPALADALDDFRPDVVHLASPFVLGASGLRSARRRGIPTIAVFQTDVAGFARSYRVSRSPLLRPEAVADSWVRRLHSRVDRTLVPSKASYAQLAALGVPGLHLWGRGVSLDLFDPVRRDPGLHRRLCPDGQLAVGYVGRLAQEKQVHRLSALADLPGTRLVVVGDGPARARLEQTLPQAAFLGMLRGAELATAFASLDVFVHTGDSETFCQTVQEAQASGVAVVAPAAGGPLDLVDPGHTGLLFHPGRSDGLREAVEQLVRNPALRGCIAEAGRAAVADRDWGSLVARLVDDHYRAVLEQHRRDRPSVLPAA